MGRIIAGSAGSVPLAAPRGGGTRPTSDRVKEALFSALASWFGTAQDSADEQFRGLAVLDLFAGTGGLGLEAASRGADRVVAVDHATSSLIRRNADRAHLRVDVRAGRVRQVLEQLQERFDLVLIDPPYDMPDDELDQLVEDLVGAARVAPRGLLVVERSARSAAPTWPDGVTETWHRRYGESTLHFGATAEELP